MMNAAGQTCLHQTLSNVTWSLAHLYTPDIKLLGLVASMATTYMEGFKPFELSMLLWGFAKTGVVEEMPHAIEVVFRTASSQITASFGHFSFRSLAMIVWAFATARQRDPRLFSGIAAEMRRNASAANCQEVGNTVWAFASAGHRDKKMLTTLAQAAVPLIREFKAQEISNMLWGFATLGFFHEEVFLSSIAAALRMDLGSQHLAIILWACSKVMPKHSAMDSLIISFAPLCVSRLGAFKPQEVSSTVQALAKVLTQDKEEAETSASNLLFGGIAPLHEDVMMLLDALAHRVARTALALTPAAFVTAVCSLLSLGERSGRRPDHVLEQAVMLRVPELALGEKVTLLEAFLSPPCVARGVVSVLAANLASALDSLQNKDFQALVQLCRTARRVPDDAADPGRGELVSWCLALAAGLPDAMLQAEGPDCEPQADADPCSGSDASSEISELDEGVFDAPAGSEYRVDTAESLPFMEWRPKA
uniref:RNA-editing substrate-binding complex 6 protein domain-containing protein n=2 Tax=Alexandrium catenella TaxID=2925 RepID=A0A7S1QSQ4_ALECA